MTKDVTEVLSALVDGETVDPSELATALRRPEAVAMLVDFVRLRAAVRADEARPALPRERLPHRAWTARRAVATLASAAVVVLAAYGALDLAGALPKRDPVPHPPAPVREIRFEPGVDWRALSEAPR